MNLDLQKDAERLHYALLGVSVVILVLLGGAWLAELNRDWRTIRAERASEPRVDIAGIVEIQNCAGDAERCTTCHVFGSKEGQKSKPHSFGLQFHNPFQMGCSLCHGGSPRALGVDTAHFLLGRSVQDPLMTAPTAEAGCIRCHLPGEVKGTEALVRGADLYLRLGCAMCHSLEPGGKGSWDFGPDLRTIGRRSLEDIRRSLFLPKEDFPGSTMPSYQSALGQDEQIASDLFVFVLSLSLTKIPECRAPDTSTGLVERPCSICHDTSREQNGQLFVHRCVLIRKRSEELKCRNCHEGSLPRRSEGAIRCPLVETHRSSCVACHSEGTGL